MVILFGMLGSTIASYKDDESWYTMDEVVYFPLSHSYQSITDTTGMFLVLEKHLMFSEGWEFSARLQIVMQLRIQINLRKLVN